MSESYLLTMAVFDGVFAVPNLVADRLRFADQKSLKPLLYLLRYGGQPVTVDELARHTNLSAQEVRDGLDFWVGEGLLRREGTDYRPETAPEASAEELYRTHAAQSAPAETVVPAARTAISDGTAPSAPAARTDSSAPAAQTPPAAAPGPLSLKLSARPAKLAPGEAASRCEKDPSLKFMLGEAERLLGRPLNTSDMSTLISLVDWAGLTPDLVLMLVGYCRDRGKTNLRYIERVGADWADKGVDSHEKAEELIRRETEEQSREREVLDAFGLDSRALSQKEKDYIAQWYDGFGFDIRMIRLAYERTVDRTGKLSLAYLHKILKSWHEKGYRTPQDASSEAQPAQRKEPSGGTPSTIDYDMVNELLYREGK